MEKARHTTHESQLQEPILVKSVSIVKSHSEISFFAQLFDMSNEIISVAFDFLIEDFKVRWDQTVGVTRLNLRILQFPILTDFWTSGYHWVLDWGF